KLEQKKQINCKALSTGRNGRWRNQHGGILPAVFVLVSEVFENLAFLANATNLVNYFYGFMHFLLAKSANTLTNFMGTSFLLALLGGFVSDTFITTYWTVITFSLVELIGLVILTIQAHYPSLKPPACNTATSVVGICKQVEGGEAAMLYIGLYLVALGVGGVKGSLPVHGADQFDENHGKERKLRSKFFNWFLFSMCAGSLLAVTFVVWVQENKGWQWGFGLSSISILLVLAFFVLDTCKYRNRIPTGSPLTRIAQVIVAAVRKRRIGNQVSTDDTNYGSDKENGNVTPRTPQFR
ncbi:hypothetical protein KI387_017464, partial [Taxus chinensis]